MATLFYTVYQDKNKTRSEHLFYGRIVHTQTIGTDELADRIQRNCSMKKSDVVAVLTELVEVMTDELQNSNKVKLDGFGTFKINCSSYGVTMKEDYNADMIKSYHVRFLPEGTKSNGVLTRTFLDGVKAQKAQG